MEMPFSLYHMYRLCVLARNVNFTFNKHLFTRCMQAYLGLLP